MTFSFCDVLLKPLRLHSRFLHVKLNVADECRPFFLLWSGTTAKYEATTEWYRVDDYRLPVFAPSTLPTRNGIY